MPASNSISSILSDIGTSFKKLPTSAVGGVADIGNMILGGYANIAELVQGKPITRSAGEGLVKKPVGGSDSLNELFGLPTGSSGLLEDSASAMLSALNPAAAIKSAMIVPAILLKSGKTIKLAEAALAKGAAPADVFNHVGIYKDPADGMLKSVLSDAEAKLKSIAVPYSNDPTKYLDTKGLARTGSPFSGSNSGPSQLLSMRGDATLGDVLDHPELYTAMPQLKDIKVIADKVYGEKGAYTHGTKTLEMGPSTSATDFMSTLLHETQHGVQFSSEFATGGNPSMFYRDPKGFNRAAARATKEETAAYDAIDEAISGTVTPNQLLAAKNSSRLASILQGAQGKAYQNYINIAGEKEARATQEMFQSGNYSNFPLDMAAGSTGRLISDPMMGNKVDNDPLVRAVIDYFNK